MSLKERLQKEFPGLTDDHFSSHYSDLYIVASLEVVQFLKKEKINFSFFVGQQGANWKGSGKVCIEIHFMNVDYFEKVYKSNSH